MSAALTVLQVTAIPCSYIQLLTADKDNLQCRSRQDRKGALPVSR